MVDCLDPNRMVKMFAMIGSDIDSTSADDLSIADTSNMLNLSNIAQLTDAIYVIPPIATYEGDGIDTSAGCYAPPVTTASSTSAALLQSGVWSSSISDGSGNLSFTLDLSFGGNEHTSALTIYFGDCYATAMTIGWYRSGSLVKTYTTASNANSIFTPKDDDVPVKQTYDRIVIQITKVNKAYCHVKLAEIEFGASYTLGSEYITGTTKLIYNHDPLGLTQSPNELDLTYLNIGGTFDDDNANQLYSNFALKNTINLNFEVTVGSSKETFLMGRYYIADRYVTGNKFNVTALDCRGLMQNVSPVYTFSTSTSIGAAITYLLNDNGITSVIDNSLNSIYPAAAVEFDGRTDLLTMVQFAVQYCEADMWVSRDGILYIGSQSSRTYPNGTIEKPDMYTYPSIESITAYNVIQITYGGSVYEIDQSGEDPRVVVAVDNPFITTLAKATSVAQRVAAGFVNYCKRVKWRGDLSMLPGDGIKNGDKVHRFGGNE